MWALKRRVFGRTLAEFQLTQAKLGDMAVSVDASALLVYRAAWTGSRSSSPRSACPAVTWARRTCCPGWSPAATELLMLGDAIDAETADRYGLVTQLTDDLDGACAALARRLADGPTLGLQQTKSLITRELDMPIGPAMELDAMTQALLMTSDDHAEFHAAFNEKRKPDWKGR